MLRMMRENAGSWIIKILLGIVVLVFIFLGIGPGKVHNENIAAVVNKKVISMDEFRFTYNNQIQRYRNQFGDSFNNDLLKMLNLEVNTLESLINNELIIQEADKLGLTVTDQEIQTEIKEIPFFQENGHFSQDKYQNYIRFINHTPSFFEALQREELLINKFMALFDNTALVSDDEVKSWFVWEKKTASIDYVLFETGSIKDVKPTDDDIQAYYDAHKDKYMSQPQTQIRFIQFNPEDYKKGITVTDEEIEKYYSENLSKYETPKTVEARHILIKVDENAPEEVVAEKELKARQIYDMAIKEGQDFSELAKTYSEGPSKDNGGYLGSFEEGKMVQPFSDKAFSMKEGEISEPVRTQFGWHVIKVEKVNPSVKRQLAEVKPEIEKTLIKERAENKAYEDVYMVYDGIISGNTMEQSAEISGHPLVLTEWFNKTAGPTEMDGTVRREVAKQVFDMEENGISDIIELGGSYYVIQVAGKKDTDVMPLADVKDRVEKDVITQMKENKAKEEAAALIASIKEGKTTLEATEGVKETKAFTRDNRGTDLGIEPPVVQAAFALTPESALSEEPVTGNKGFYVIRLKEMKSPDLALLEKEKTRIYDSLKKDKQDQAFSTWLEQTKAKSDIERNPSISKQ